MADKFPSDKQDKFMLRMPDGMRDEIARLAKATGRSMNAEIVARLQQSFPPTRAATDFKEKLDKYNELSVAVSYAQRLVIESQERVFSVPSDSEEQRDALDELSTREERLTRLSAELRHLTYEIESEIDGLSAAR